MSAPTPTPLVSVFIRVRDESAALDAALRRLGEQVLDAPVELIVLDNDSADDSAWVARSHGARVFTLPRALFGYGRALNIGAELAAGEIVIFLSAHSIPQSRNWIARLIRPLRDDPSVGAAFCRQVPARPLSRAELHRFACFPSKDVLLDRDTFVNLCRSGGDPYAAALFSSSACAVRRSVALRHRFRDLLYAEDRAFVVDYVIAGGAVAYVHAPAVAYERRMTWKSAYAAGRRAQVSKRLIRELAGGYAGWRFDSRRDTAGRIARALLILPATLVRLGLALREPRELRRRAAMHALVSTGTTLGMTVGALRWRRHIDTLSCDPVLLREARRQTRPLE
jgi:glycosyltransferase involved in cell wall biosynthesis